MKQMKNPTWIYWLIESQLTNVGMEMIRLDNAIGDIGIGVDVLVYSQMEVDKRGHIRFYAVRYKHHSPSEF
jgi:hypothetical protein